MIRAVRRVPFYRLGKSFGLAFFFIADFLSSLKLHTSLCAPFTRLRSHWPWVVPCPEYRRSTEILKFQLCLVLQQRNGHPMDIDLALRSSNSRLPPTPAAGCFAPTVVSCRVMHAHDIGSSCRAWGKKETPRQPKRQRSERQLSRPKSGEQ